MKRRYQKFTAVSTAITLAMSMVLTSSLNVSAAAENDSNSSSNSDGKYEIYPKPQKIEYKGGDYILDRNINVVYEEGIDQATRNRLQEITDLKNIKISESEEIKNGATNILVGTADNDDQIVDNYIKEKEISTEELFKKTDSYVLNSDNNTIAVLGKDNDSSFYGLTTLYHIIKQIDSYTIANFNIEDYADIVSRGFIEGYYGEPWSTEDRVNLMNWSGYYKLNSYFYAPKDDPKHNKNWRELYSEEEIEEKIKPLAEAGNNSKTRFVYALHPFMNSPMAKPDTDDAQYQEDLEILKKKFKQVIDAGVRQIAILADDAAHWGNKNYIRLLEDMTDWLKELKQEEKYKDLKTTLPFCTQEYMYNGEEYYRDFPEEVQIVMTGGKVWGEVTDQFTSTFTQKAGRGPYMWINWPCTDNSKKHLIMGGYSNFLHPNVNPKNIEGIVLNPMQQSEPSKVAIFGNAAYSWNIWNSKEEADKAWNDSFKYVDHNSAIENEASNALRELSKHMINQAMDGRVVKLEESVELKKVLNPFKEKLNNGTVTVNDIEKIENEFTILKEATEVFEKQAGDPELKKQMEPWIECWKDTTEAVLQYMKALRALDSGNTTTMVNAYSLGNKAFNDSRKHGFSYIDHLEYAEVGVQHIVPFIKSLDSYLSKKVSEVSDPTIITKKFISNVFKNPESGSLDNVFDENDQTSVQFKEPNYINENDYFGVEFNRPIDVNSIRIVSGGGKNHFFNSKLEYKTGDNDEWVSVNDETYSRPQDSTEEIAVDNLNLENVKAIRLVATADNNIDSWLEIKSIDINKKVNNDKTSATVTGVGVKIANNPNVNDSSKNNKFEYIVDGKENTLAWMSNNSESDGGNIRIDNGIQIDFNKSISIKDIKITQGDTDRIQNLTIKYKNGENDWVELGNTTEGSNKVVTIDGRNIETTAIQILSTNNVDTWWQLAEVEVIENSNTKTVKPVGVQIGKNPAINEGQKNNKFEYIIDGKKDTLAWMSNEGDNDVIKANTGVEIDLGKSTSIKDIKITQDDNDKLRKLTVEYKKGKNSWETLSETDSSSNEVIVDGKNIETTGIRILSTEDVSTWWKLVEVEVIENPKSTAANVISNVDNHNFKASVGKEKSILTGGQITLKPNDYIGIDLKEIKAITNVEISNDVNLRENNVSLQVSKNGKVWESVNLGELNNEKARYVTLVNNSDNDVALNIESLTVNTLVIGKMGELVSSDIQAIDSWGDTRNNGKAFDGDMNTKTKFGGNPQQGNSIVYSFGQEIDVKSLRFYVSDSEKDFLRDANVYLSMDGKNWDEKVFTIGDGVADDRETTIKEKDGIIDSNYPNVFYVGKDDINQRAKYLKIEMTVNYPNRAIVLNEIMVNNGAYISSEDNQAFTGTIETRGNMPSNMLDKNISTSYIGSEKNGHITYDLSNGDGISAFRLVQIGEVSGAKVTAELFDEKAKDGEKVSVVEVGTLNQAINEFNVPSGKTLLSVKVSWGEKIPQIAEFITLTRNKEEEETVNKTALRQLINSKPKEYDNWTRSSKENYDNLINVAHELDKNDYVSQASVDSVVSGICQAINDAELKGDIEALRKALDEKVENNNIYTAISYAAYESALNKIEDALKDENDISQKEADKLLSRLETAKNALVYSIINREIAEITIRSYDASVSENYTKESMNNWTKSYDELKSLIDEDKASSTNEERVNPEELAKATNAYKEAMDALVDVKDLKALISEFEKMTGQGYTEGSFNVYKEAVESARPLLENGTKAEVEAAMLSIQSAKEQLQTNEKYLEDVAGRIESMSGDYTSESYDAFKKAFEAAQSVSPEDDTFEQLIKELEKAEKNLVSITGLKNLINQFNSAPQKDNWTISYANKVNELLQVANNLFVNGTREEIDSVSKQLESLYKEQVICAEGVKEYQDSIEKKNESAYTTESYAEYEKAYNALMALNPKDVTTEKFLAVKEAYELAVANLVLLDVPGQGGIGNEGNQGNQGNGSGVRPGDGNGSSNGNDPSNDNSSSNGNNSSNGNGSTSGNANVQTGDNSIFGMIFVAISALSLLVYTNMTKRRNQ